MLVVAVVVLRMVELLTKHQVDLVVEVDLEWDHLVLLFLIKEEDLESRALAVAVALDGGILDVLLKVVMVLEESS